MKEVQMDLFLFQLALIKVMPQHCITFVFMLISHEDVRASGCGDTATGITYL